MDLVLWLSVMRRVSTVPRPLFGVRRTLFQRCVEADPTLSNSPCHGQSVTAHESRREPFEAPVENRSSHRCVWLLPTIPHLRSLYKRTSLELLSQRQELVGQLAEPAKAELDGAWIPLGEKDSGT